MGNGVALDVNRRLAAIAFADVAGYSRLVATDEVGTIRRWEQLREEVLDPLFHEFRGRLIDVAGDSVLIEFRSAAQALRWAVDAQRAVSQLNADGQEPPLSLRVGVHVDDVIVEGKSVKGDGINIASRIHQAALPGQVVVSGIVRELAGNRFPLLFKDLGTPRLKNIERVVHLFAVEWERDASARLHQPFLAWTSRPTVAVMPFLTLGEAERSDYFGQGITEDIITGLSRSRSFHVIARASMLRYAERTRDVRDIAAELGVKYVLDGTVRRQRKKLRINAELIDVSQNRTIWADRFDGADTDVFDFQDGIVSAIVGALEPNMRAAEIDRVRDRPTSSLDAYDCVLKALSQLFLFTDDSFRQSGQALDRALELDPNYAQAWAYSAWRLNFRFGEEQSENPEADRARAIECARLAVQLDPEDVIGLAISGHLLSFAQGRPHEALALFDTALNLDPNSAFAWAQSGITLCYCGRPEEALERFRNAFRLSPFDRLIFSWWCGAGTAEFVAGRCEEAAMWLRKAHRWNPRYVATLRMLAASLGIAGHEEEAKAIGRELLQVDPDFTVSRFVSWYPLQRKRDLQRLEEGLLQAGLPP